MNGRMRIFGALVLAALLSVPAVLMRLNHLDEDTPPAALPPEPAQVLHGQYLARVGHCAGCHTARGGAAWAGGRAIATPFGTVYAANLTPDPDTGLGRWTVADFWRALHNGRSSDGRLLAPACPYPNFSQVTPGDVADLFAYLRSQPAVRQANRPHALRFPYGTQAALAVWRALYFRPGAGPTEPGRSPEWQRGAYLVAGLGHCGACHGSRNAWGATDGALDLRGGEVPMQGWLAPALDDPRAAGVADWPLEQVVALLKTGVNDRASVSGPMAMVVMRSTQFIDDADLRAIAVYLKSLPAAPAHNVQGESPSPAQAELGGRIYDHHCAGCHGRSGEGAPGAVPALAGNRALAQAAPDNLLKVMLLGAFAPATAGNPRPYGMPPFATLLSDDELAAVASVLRSRWGGGAPPVSAREVNRARGG